MTTRAAWIASIRTEWRCGGPLSAGGMYWAFGMGFFTIFPLFFCGVAGLMALAAGKPDEERAHF